METISKELYEDDAELKRHLSAIQNLALTFKIPLVDIVELYENSLKEIRKDAKVKDFISVLVIREVQETLRENSHALK